MSSPAPPTGPPPVPPAGLAAGLPADAWLRPGVVTTANGDGMTLVNAAGAVFTLGPSGRAAVEALRAGGVGASLAALRRRYGLAEDTAAADLARLLAQMHAAKLIRVRGQ
jgi:hypothetical protein